MATIPQRRGRSGTEDSAPVSVESAYSNFRQHPVRALLVTEPMCVANVNSPNDPDSLL